MPTVQFSDARLRRVRQIISQRVPSNLRWTDELKQIFKEFQAIGFRDEHIGDTARLVIMEEAVPEWKDFINDTNLCDSYRTKNKLDAHIKYLSDAQDEISDIFSALCLLEMSLKAKLAGIDTQIPALIERTSELRPVLPILSDLQALLKSAEGLFKQTFSNRGHTDLVATLLACFTHEALEKIQPEATAFEMLGTLFTRYAHAANVDVDLKKNPFNPVALKEWYQEYQRRLQQACEDFNGEQ